MRKTIFAIALLISQVVAAQTFNAEFNDEYDARVKDLDETWATYKSGFVTPVWKDETTFLYKSGDKYYEVNSATGVSTPATKGAYESLTPIPTPYDPSDDTLYAVKKSEPVTSPDGTLVAFLKDNNLWIRKDGTEKQLSYDGTEACPYIKIMWSPDSRKIAATRKEVIKEREIILRNSRPDDQVQPKYKYLNYCKPGDVLPQEYPALFDAINQTRIDFPVTAYQNQYFLDLGQWSPDSKYFTFEYNQRGHQLYQLVAVDAASGKNTVLAEEKSSTFVYYYDIFRYYFADGKRILWTSERDNWRHLYMIDATTGKMTQLTKGEWNVREVLKVDEQNNLIYLNVNGLKASKGEDPYNKHLCKLDLASGKLTDLTPADANHSCYFAGDGKSFIDNYSRPDLPGGSVLRSAVDGSEISKLGTTDISGMEAKGFTMPIVFKAKGRDGKTDIWGTIYLPYNFDKSKTYNVIEYIYAGPHDSHVIKDFYPFLRFTRLMEMGFVVVSIDGMGTDNRSKTFQDVCYRNLKDAGFPDRILWMQAAAKKYKWMDISNVGIYGYSAGGQNTLAALLFHPEFYKVGVALCGCHDNRMDKMWWNEQWMGYPIGPWYSENSNVDNAYRLEGKLFIINGEMDDNVDPASSLQVVSELVKNNKYFEQMFLPGHTHALGSDYISKRVFEFFWKNIKNQK